MGTSPHPRVSAFLPWKVPGGPGRKTRLTPERSTRGVNSNGQQFRVDDSWERPIQSMIPTTPWTGRTRFLVDKTHTDRWGTDQRRQRVEAANFQDAQSEKESSRHDLFDEEVHSSKSRWLKLSDDKTSDWTYTHIPLRSKQYSVRQLLTRSSTTPCR